MELDDALCKLEAVCDGAALYQAFYEMAILEFQNSFSKRSGRDLGS